MHGTAVGEPAGGAVAAVGSQWMQAYLYRTDDGHHRIHQACFDLREQRWTPVAPVLDAIRGPWPGAAKTQESEVAARSFEVQCSGCHSSGSELKLDLETNRMEAHIPDFAIDCESCHGPGDDHAKAWKNLEASKPMARLKEFTPRRANAVCARCHGGPPTDGDFAPADARDYVAVLKDREGFFPDGTASGQVYQYPTFVRSPCFTEGGLMCTGCHDAHADKLRHESHPDALCTRCHAEQASRAHTHHDVRKEGARCVNCHMPRLLGGMLRHQRDHRIGNPLPASPHVPDACTTCHADKDKAWSDAAYRKWWGEPPRETLMAIEAIVLARAKDPRAEALLRRARRHPDAFFRANAAIYLRDPGAAIDDPSPEVRLAAVLAAQRDADLLRLLDDEEPRVRAAAAVRLAERGKTIDKKYDPDLDLATRQVRDWALPRILLGARDLEAKRFAAAERRFMRAVSTRPAASDAWLGLALSYTGQGREKQARLAHHRRALILRGLYMQHRDQGELAVGAAEAFILAGLPEEAERIGRHVPTALRRRIAALLEKKR
ncbi:MAG: ammonia-forming cytochrome c nitrite reductase subunit c552 [Planctomycetota bacterium]|jgi:hypothetical protein